MWVHVGFQALDRQVSVLGASTSSSAAASLDACLGEVEDLLTYCDDILATGGLPGSVPLLSPPLPVANAPLTPVAFCGPCLCRKCT